jgi:uncharacterized membrane protein YhaH (DUF805 family)
MSSPSSGSDPHYPQGGPPQGQPGWGAPQQPGGYPAPAYAPAYAATPAAQMGLTDAVRSVLTNYANFSGRARRSEYWWFILAYFLASVVAAIIDAALGAPVLEVILILGLLVPSLAVGVRRLHDTDRSGWWLLLGLIPFGGIVVLVFSCLDSQVGTNRFGPSPKYPQS